MTDHPEDLEPGALSRPTTVTFVTKKVTKIGRPTVKRKAMSAAERQRRHRKKVAGRSRAEGSDELHETPACAVHALLKAEQLPHHLWDPGCGPGAIVRILRGTGHTVTASDIRNYDSLEHVERILRKVGHDDIDATLAAYIPPGQDFVQDFLKVTAIPPGVEAAIFNPPFTKAAAFVRHALALGISKVIMLQRLAWMESTTKDRRMDLLEGGHLARVHIFRKRLPRMHRFGWSGKKAAPNEGNAWYVFDIQHCGKPTMHWL